MCHKCSAGVRGLRTVTLQPLLPCPLAAGEGARKPGPSATFLVTRGGMMAHVPGELSRTIFCGAFAHAVSHVPTSAEGRRRLCEGCRARAVGGPPRRCPPWVWRPLPAAGMWAQRPTQLWSGPSKRIWRSKLGISLLPRGRVVPSFQPMEGSRLPPGWGSCVLSWGAGPGPGWRRLWQHPALPGPRGPPCPPAGEGELWTRPLAPFWWGGRGGGDCRAPVGTPHGVRSGGGPTYQRPSLPQLPWPWAAVVGKGQGQTRGATSEPVPHAEKIRTS